MSNIYSMPESDLLIDTGKSTDVFERFNTWYTIGLSIITLSFYMPYWLYTRSKSLNQIVDNKISSLFINTVITLYVLSFLIGIGEVFYENIEIYSIVSTFTNLAANILFIVCVFRFRNRLQNEVADPQVKVGIVLTFFFQIFYLQYKINELIDIDQHNKSLKSTSLSLGDLG